MCIHIHIKETDRKMDGSIAGESIADGTGRGPRRFRVYTSESGGRSGRRDRSKRRVNRGGGTRR